MSRSCGHESVINRGHLNPAGQKTAMVARCFLTRNHEFEHRYVYKHILDDEVERWRGRVV